MPYYFYADANGTKQTVNEQQLQGLINQGIILATTPLETDTGHTGLAGQIPGLNFNTAAPSPFAQPTQAVPQRTSGMHTQPNVNPVVNSLVSWLLDFAFRDLRLPVINHWACRIIYAVCCVGAILWGVIMTFTLLGLALDSSGHADTGPVMFFVIPLAWLGVALCIFAARLFCEWYIIVFDWIVETTKAARIYVKNNEREQEA